MYPVKIRLYGIRDIDTVELDIGKKDDMLLFGGVNGTGKSTLSFAIAYALGSEQISSETLRSKTIDISKDNWRALVEIIFHNPYEEREIDAPDWVSLGVTISQKPNQQAYPHYFSKHGETIDQLHFFRKYRSREEAREDYELKYGISPDKFFMFWFQNTITRFATMKDRERFEYVAEMYGLRETQESWERAKTGRQEAQEDFERVKLRLENEKLRVELAEKKFNIWRQWNNLITEGVALKRQYLLEKQRFISYKYSKLDDRLEQYNAGLSKYQGDFNILDQQINDTKQSIEKENEKFNELNERRKSRKEERDKLNLELEKIRLEYNKLDQETKDVQDKYKRIRPKEELLLEKNQFLLDKNKKKKSLDDVVSELVELKENQSNILQQIGGLQEKKYSLEQRIEEWESYFSFEEPLEKLQQLEKEAKDNYFNVKQDLEQYKNQEIDLKREYDHLKDTKVVSHPLQDQSIRYYKDKGIDVYPFGELFEIKSNLTLEKVEYHLNALKYTLFVNGPIGTAPNHLLHVSLFELRESMLVDNRSDDNIILEELLDWKEDSPLSSDEKKLITHWLQMIYFNKKSQLGHLKNHKFAVLSDGSIKEILGWRGSLSSGAAIGRNAWIQRIEWIENQIKQNEASISTLSANENQFLNGWKSAEKRRELYEERHSRLPQLNSELRLLKDQLNGCLRKQQDLTEEIKQSELEKSGFERSITFIAITIQNIESDLLIHEQFGELSDKIDKLRELSAEILVKGTERDKLTYEINDIDESIEGSNKRSRQANDLKQSLENQQNILRNNIIELNEKIEDIRRESNSLKDEEILNEASLKEFKGQYKIVLGKIDPYEYTEFEVISESRLKDWEDSARRKLNDAESMIIDEQAEEKYHAVLVSYRNAEKETLAAESLLLQMLKDEEKLRDMFRKMVYDRYQRVNQHFQNYIQRIGFRGKIEQVEPDETDLRRKFYEWRLYIATKPGHDMEYLRPIEGIRQKIVSGPSGGEIAVISLMFALALLTDIEKRPPFYMLDEFDSALDEWRKGIVIDLYKEILKRKLMIISPKSHATDYLSRFSMFYAFVTDHKEGKSRILRLERETYKEISQTFID